MTPPEQKVVDEILKFCVMQCNKCGSKDQIYLPYCCEGHFCKKCFLKHLPKCKQCLRREI